MAINYLSTMTTTMLLRARQQVTLHGVALFHGDSCTAAGTLLNLAPSGCAIQSERSPSVGDYVNVALLIPNSDPVLADVAKVRWIEDGRLGLEFLRIEQRDQVRAKRLVQLSAGATPYRRRGGWSPTTCPGARSTD
jgi:PilZ domain